MYLTIFKLVPRAFCYIALELHQPSQDAALVELST